MSKSPLRRTAAALTALVAFLGLAQIAAAQGSPSIAIHSADSVSFIVQRRAPTGAEPSVRTTDGKVVLILRDTVVVMQLTDYGMSQLLNSDPDTVRATEGFLARMARATAAALFDNGIAYKLSALRDAYADGSRLVLEDRAGTHVFENTKINGHSPMEELDPSEATRFAAKVKRAIPAAAR